MPELSIVKGSWVGGQGEGVFGAFRVSLASLSGLFFPPYALSTIFHACTPAPKPAPRRVAALTL